MPAVDTSEHGLRDFWRMTLTQSVVRNVSALAARSWQLLRVVRMSTAISRTYPLRWKLAIAARKREQSAPSAFRDSSSRGDKRRRTGGYLAGCLDAAPGGCVLPDPKPGDLLLA